MRPEFSPSGSEFHLHRIWKELNFSLLRLRSTDGRQIRILDPGTHNCTTGPDFRNAHILADGIDLFGDVEIHLSANHWYEHKHHKDPNFNRVILHVVADPTPVLVKNEAGFTLLTLSLGPYLRARQRTFRKELSYRNNLRCLSHLHYISEDAFNAQIRKAHREYFNLKSEDFLKYYDPHLSGSKAWKKSLITWIFDGLGISHNRDNMRMLLQSILPSDLPEELIIQDVLDKAGLSDPESSGIPWNLKSVSRADHPKYRIPQAVKIANQILKQTFGDILRDHDLCLWKEWLQRSGIKETDRYRILYGTVFLPAMFNAGQLYHDQHLSEYAFHRWKHLQSPIPKILLRPFDHPEITSDYHHSKLGSIYQLRSYCEQSRCHDCLVLKKAIWS